MNTKQIVALAVGVPVVLLAPASIAIYRASVHEQICLSYENQAKNQLEESIKTVKEMYSAMTEISRNPLTGFAYISLIPQWNERSNALTKKGNDWRYAYSKTCGVERREKFLETPEMKEKVARLDVFRRSIVSYKF